jgi:hypothetical protein
VTAILIVVLNLNGFSATFSDVGACIAVRDDLRKKYQVAPHGTYPGYVECWAAGSNVPTKGAGK